MWFETFKGNVNRTNTVNFDAHWTSGAKKGGFEIFLSNRLVVKFLPPEKDSWEGRLEAAVISEILYFLVRKI